MVQVCHLLAQHVLRIYLLGMESFLPDLMAAVYLVLMFMKLQLVTPRSQAPAWERYFGPKLRLGLHLQFVYLQRPIQPGIVPGAGIEPVLRPFNQPRPYRIMVQVIHLLAQHVLRI